MNSLVTNLRVFWQGTILSYIALFHWLEPVTYLASKVLMPLAQILFFTLLGTFATGRDTTSFLCNRQRDPDCGGERYLWGNHEHRG